jgi:hypothetical protein
LGVVIAGAYLTGKAGADAGHTRELPHDDGMELMPRPCCLGVGHHGIRCGVAPSEDPEATMSKLKTEEREDLSKSKFALPEERKYPIEDKAHARNAKARAAQQEKAGNLSAADRKKVDAKADKVLGKD